MVRSDSIRMHELTFCGQVKSWCDALFAQHAEWPFDRAEIEERGRGNNKRADLRIYDRDHQGPILSGEAKMPGTPEGRSPYDPALMQDAYQKADNIQCPYFFTWNVNTFVLFDRSRWDVPMIDRSVQQWDLQDFGLHLTDAEDCASPQIQSAIREKLLPRIFSHFAGILTGKLVNWQMPPEDVFVRSLETHLDWPVVGTRDYLAARSETDEPFATRLREWMTGDMGWTVDPTNAQAWSEVLLRAARSLCYVFSNRAIFYEALRARYPTTLSPLAMPGGKKPPAKIYDYFRRRFETAIRASGDYEPILQANDWASSLVLESPKARQGWKGLLKILPDYDFSEIPSDMLGRIFQKLISPEERRKFGQFFTDIDLVDLINAFCIRRAGDLVLDPACGSGSFLVRAYHRKAWLSGQKGGGRRHEDHDKTHQQLLRELFGCDIAYFPAHLATLNLASRRITDEENYPYVARRNFFEVAQERDVFCRIPRPGTRGQQVREQIGVPLPDLDAVVGNPPYLRQEQIPRLAETKPRKGEAHATYQSRLQQTKEVVTDLCSTLWPGLKLSGRSDLHCYFWPVATAIIKEGGYFGFLTSSSWLDVEYGFALQKWILKNFRLLAVIESLDEPWFEDARVKTAVTILQRSADPKKRDANRVKFVRLKRPLAEILGPREEGDEAARQNAAERLRDLIEKTKTEYEDERLRIICIPQARLWEEGVKAGALLKGAPPSEDSDEAEDAESDSETAAMESFAGDYAAGKWGRFLRAPDLYFRLMREYAHRFVKLGEIAEIRFGIKSGCDAFFMPRDVTDEILRQVAEDGRLWRDLGLMTPCKIAEVEKGKVRIVRAGDTTLHPIEAKYLRPEVHSLMQVDRPVVRAKDLDRVVLWVSEPLHKLAGTYVAKYIRWGAKQTFQSSKSKAVHVPQRSTCASRSLWYDLTGAATGIAFWPMAQQYRHFAPENPDVLLCNHRMFYINGRSLSQEECRALVAILNSTMIAYFKTFYGRYTGTEGSLDTEVLDVNLMEVPDPRDAQQALLTRLQKALRAIQARAVGHLVESALMDCHTADEVMKAARTPLVLSEELRQPDRRELDDAVLELIGVESASDRAALLEELYRETASHYRRIRIVEVQKMEQRAGGRARRFSPQDLAVSIWDSLSEDEKGPPVNEWLLQKPGRTESVTIPEGRPFAFGPDHMLHPCGVDFKVAKHTTQMDYASPEQAALVTRLALLDVRGEVRVPADAKVCRRILHELQARLAAAEGRFAEVAASRTGTERLQHRTAELLMQWYIHGRAGRDSPPP
jgi:hypothetical protein